MAMKALREFKVTRLAIKQAAVSMNGERKSNGRKELMSRGRLYQIDSAPPDGDAGQPRHEAVGNNVG